MSLFIFFRRKSNKEYPGGQKKISSFSTQKLNNNIFCVKNYYLECKKFCKSQFMFYLYILNLNIPIINSHNRTHQNQKPLTKSPHWNPIKPKHHPLITHRSIPTYTPAQKISTVPTPTIKIESSDSRARLARQPYTEALARRPRFRMCDERAGNRAMKSRKSTLDARSTTAGRPIVRAQCPSRYQC